jgi:hypothetical protein
VSYRNLRLIIESILVEGVKDDLMSLYPNHSNDIKSLQPKWLAWLNARFGKNPNKEEIHPFADALETVKVFAQKDAAIGAKYKSNEQFRSAVDEAFPPGSRSWNNPSDPSNMAVDEMETIIKLSERKKQRFEVRASNVEEDRIGKIGSWNLWMPSTRENSCEIAQYDPATLAPKTNWCTARMSGSNLFYNYVGRAGSRIILFYAIKDGAKSHEDWLSIGYVDGKPSFTGQAGSISVDGMNRGLTADKLHKILGVDHDKIMKVFDEKANEYGGAHPASVKIENAAKSIEAFKSLTEGLSKEEEADLAGQILKSAEVSKDVYMHCANHLNPKVRAELAKQLEIPGYVKEILLKDEHPEVLKVTLNYKEFPPENARKLFDIAIKDESNYLIALRELASKQETPVDVLERLTDVKDESSLEILAREHHTPSSVLEKLYNKRLSKPKEELKEFDTLLLSRLANNPNTPTSILLKLYELRDRDITRLISHNPSAPEEILRDLLASGGFKSSLVTNTNLPKDMFEKIFNAAKKDRDIFILQGLSHNRRIPVDILQQMVELEDDYLNDRIVYAAAANKAIPDEILQPFTRSENANLRKAAKKVLRDRKEERKKKTQQNEAIFRKLIRLLL